MKRGLRDGVGGKCCGCCLILNRLVYMESFTPVESIWNHMVPNPVFTLSCDTSYGIYPSDRVYISYISSDGYADLGLGCDSGVLQRHKIDYTTESEHFAFYPVAICSTMMVHWASTWSIWLREGM